MPEPPSAASEIPLWFERKFRFDFPVELYPNLRVRLPGTPARLEELTRGLAPAQLALADRLDVLPAETFARSALHPRLQVPMRLVDHLFFVAEHDDHHRARIWELRRRG
jgi:uncharacterized damage-inducible protein DinB